MNHFQNRLLSCSFKKGRMGMVLTIKSQHHRCLTAIMLRQQRNLSRNLKTSSPPLRLSLASRCIKYGSGNDNVYNSYVGMYHVLASTNANTGTLMQSELLTHRASLLSAATGNITNTMSLNSQRTSYVTTTSAKNNNETVLNGGLGLEQQHINSFETHIPSMKDATYSKDNVPVGRWLVFMSGMVAAIIVIGGITRLTESGLSMVSWHPVYGIRPPVTQAEWEKEFEEYKKYPEYKELNKDMTLDKFKNIFFWEYLHRMWGRSIGLCFIIPASYFAFRGRLTSSRMPHLKKVIVATAGLIGFQGFMGWYMVKSGLCEKQLEERGSIPRVSQYRLAAHLGTAIVIFSLTLTSGLKLLYKPTPFKHQSAAGLLSHSKFIVATVFLTALSGAFVAGLDAGLTYNSFPKMAGKWVPDDVLALEPTWKNLLENPTTVQFDHRLLGMTTFSAITLLWLRIMSCNKTSALPPRLKLASNCLMAMACTQVGLGVSTLLLYVPIHLAAAHQSGSVVLLTMAIWMTKELGACVGSKGSATGKVAMKMANSLRKQRAKLDLKQNMAYSTYSAAARSNGSMNLLNRSLHNRIRRATQRNPHIINK